MGETRNCFKLIISIIKLLGSFPVSENYNKITFQWYSFKMFCYVSLFLSFHVHFLYNIYDNFIDYVFIVFDASGMAIQISFLIMAFKWSGLMKECDKFDLYMKGYGFPKYLKLKLQILCVTLIGFSLATYSIFDVSLSEKPLFDTWSFIGIFRTATQQEVTLVSACKLLLVIVRKLCITQIEVLRCCVDIFIITASVILSMRFRQIRERIDSLIRKKVQKKNVWMRTGEDYQRLCMFSEKWDNVLGYFVLFSFTSNFYNLLLHIQGSLKPLDTTDTLHTTCAAIENLLRIITVCYSAGNVYEETRRLVRILFLTPSDLFNEEIKIMLLQLRQKQPALTGKQLFTIKHPLILQIFGGIVTHEIILLQYYSPRKI